MGIRGIGTISKYNFKKETIIVILAAVCVLGFTQNAYGDNLINNLGAATVDAGDTVTVSYKLQQTSANQGDPIDGCNAGVDGDADVNGDPIVVEFVMGTSPEEAGITFDPSTLRYDHCSTNERIVVQITTSRAGVFTITPILTNDGLGGEFQIMSAITVLTVLDTIPPVIAFHDDEIIEATSAAGAVVTYISPATSDNVDPPGTAT